MQVPFQTLGEIKTFLQENGDVHGVLDKSPKYPGEKHKITKILLQNNQ